MSTPPGSRRPEASRRGLLAAQPQIFVTDLPRALAFYRDGLGFEAAYVYGEPPHYALVTRESVGLNLRHVDALPFDPARLAAEDLLAATIVVEDALGLFRELEARGLAFHQRYRAQPWGAHDFIVADPDGNLVHFASRPGEP